MTKPKRRLEGQSFGYLTVVCQADDYIRPDGRHETRWHCKCRCGKEIDVTMSNLVSGRMRGCGCARVEHSITHNDSYSRLYSIWSNMKSRCYNANNWAYNDYGGRGITICDEWINDYLAFKSWAISSGYSDDLTIDRIDNNGGYSPSNCRWATQKTQSNNRRSCHYVTVGEMTKTISEWADYLGTTKASIDCYARRHGITVEDRIATLYHDHEIASIA